MEVRLTSKHFGVILPNSTITQPKVSPTMEHVKTDRVACVKHEVHIGHYIGHQVGVALSSLMRDSCSPIVGCNGVLSTSLAWQNAGGI